MNSSWLISHKRSANSKFRLFCFHYAGGSASFCNNWAKQLPREIEVIAIQLPGREQRFAEPCYTRMPPLIEALLQEIGAYLDKPYFFFGHSMGAIISYELACEIQRQGKNSPSIFMPSGRQAPQFPEKSSPIHDLPDDEFCIEFLNRHYSNELNSVLESQELRELFIPQLRADFELADTYIFDPSNSSKFGCPIIAFDCEIGRDCIEEQELSGWGMHTTNYFRSYRLPGNHFFIESEEERLLVIIRDELANVFPELKYAGSGKYALRSK